MTQDKQCCSICFSAGDFTDVGCVLPSCPCHATQDKQPTWRDARQNLVKLAEDKPAMLLDAIDAAYLAGLDDKHALFTSLISQLEGMKQDNVDGAEFSTYTAARNSTLSDAQELIRNNYLQ